MKKILLFSFLCSINLPSFGQANTYSHDRVDTTIFAVADTVGHGANHYYATNTGPDFNIKQYGNGCTVNLFIKKGNTGSSSLTLITKTGTLSTKTIKKPDGQNLISGDIKDSTALIFTFYGSYWRCQPMGNSGGGSSQWVAAVSPTTAITYMNGAVAIGTQTVAPGNQFQIQSSGSVIGTYSQKNYNSIGTELFSVGSDGQLTCGNSNGGLAIGLNSSIGTVGNDNMAIGWISGLTGMTGSENTLIGAGTGHDLTTGSYNTSLGYASLRHTTSGLRNTAVGYQALVNNSIGSNNTAMGYFALAYNLGDKNDAYGWNCLQNNSTGHDNVVYGNEAMTLNTTGYSNSILGPGAMHYNVTGYQNTALGYEAMQLDSTGHDNVAIGYQAGWHVKDGSNNLFIGNHSGNYGRWNNKGFIDNLDRGDSANILAKSIIQLDFSSTVSSQKVTIKAALFLLPMPAPLSPIEGEIYSDSSDHHLYFYNGTIWKQLDN